MPRDRLPRITEHYSQTGRRNRGRPLKRLLDTWNRNGSTSGLTPWQTYHDDDKNYFEITCMFPKIGYFTLFHDPAVNVSSAAPVLKICASAMLLLLTVGIRSYGIWVSWTAEIFITRFTQFGNLVQQLRRGDWQRQVVLVEKKVRLKWRENEMRMEKDSGLD